MILGKFFTKIAYLGSKKGWSKFGFLGNHMILKRHLLYKVKNHFLQAVNTV
jgi:hypothetical protein